jgi:L-histidine Nalpha-methyltransferase
MQSSSSAKQNAFAEDVRRGLSANPKSLSSKYFYDDEGSRLFQQIMNLPEYYLTRAEQEIFETQTAEIFKSFTDQTDSFDLIELGAGDGTKTAVLIDYFLRQNIDFTYSPIDISGEAIEILTGKFAERFPKLKINAKTGDYFRILGALKSESKRRKILLFLGSNIGNFSGGEAADFFQHLRSVMNENDFLFVGFDLQKDPRVIVQAYDDAAGITAAFNLNLLKRINRELGADFNLENFSHYALYQPNDGAARSFLISRQQQTVFIKALNQNFHFEQWEPIFMEISQKYSLGLIENLAASGGFLVAQNFFDEKRFFVDSLWKV